MFREKSIQQRCIAFILKHLNVLSPYYRVMVVFFHLTIVSWSFNAALFYFFKLKFRTVSTMTEDMNEIRIWA